MSGEIPHKDHRQGVRRELAKEIMATVKSEFGEEALPNQVLADCFGLTESAVTSDEWTEIREFALNGGVDLYRAAYSGEVGDLLELDNSDDFTNKFHQLLSSIPRNGKNIFPGHDLFHAAEAYRLSDGRTTNPAFAGAPSPDIYTDSAVVRQELYPLLFLSLNHDPMGSDLKPLGMAFETPEAWRALLSSVVDPKSLPGVIYSEGQGLYNRPFPTTTKERRDFYEDWVEWLLVANLYRQIGSPTADQLQAVHQAMAEAKLSPAPHYDAFANKVFAQEYKTNPRLFLEELLTCIRAV